jgi:hypothetical protein
MKALVVIPNDSTYVAAWSLERCVQLNNMGFEVTCLDLSSLDYLTSLGKIRRMVNTLSYKNKWKSCMKILEKEEVFTSTKVRFPSFRFRKIKLSYFESSVLEGATLATFAWDFGSSQLSQAQISRKARERGRKIFEIALATVKDRVFTGRFDLITTVNGRGFADSAVMAVARQNHFPYELIEKTTENWGYFSIMKTTSQDCKEFSRIIQEIWGSAREERSEMRKIGHEYFENKIFKTRTLGNAKKPKLLNDSQRPYVAFFPGSDYELAAFPTSGREGTTFKSQYEAFACLAEACKELGLELVVRVHPHHRESVVGLTEDRIWRSCADAFGARMIGASDSSDSLELAINAHTNVVYESSIGAEIAYLGYPVILTAFATYAPFVPELQAFDSDSVKDLLVAPKTLTDNAMLIPWGYVMATGEIPINSFSMRSHDEIFFRGKLVEQAKPGLTLLNKLIYKINEGLRGSAGSRNLSVKH